MRARIGIIVLCLFIAHSGYANWPAPSHQRGLIIVVDGTGGDMFATVGIRSAVERTNAPLEMVSERWSDLHGVVVDHTFADDLRRAASGVVAKVAASRRAYPGRRITLVGYSAGTSAVLTAAEQLPPNSVDRIVLLAASVGHDYDLRGALRASREGLDSFYSEYDHVLREGVRYVGTTDGKRVPAAGLIGFSGGRGYALEPQLYRKLRQYPWRQEYHAYGNYGGHFGWVRPRFVEAFVLPLIAGRA